MITECYETFIKNVLRNSTIGSLFIISSLKKRNAFDLKVIVIKTSYSESVRKFHFRGASKIIAAKNELGTVRRKV